MSVDEKPHHSGKVTTENIMLRLARLKVIAEEREKREAEAKIPFPDLTFDELEPR
jgi:hypothetical protein